MVDVLDKIEPTRVEIPYKPRKHFIAMHKSPKRWKFVVAHRRAGKSVSEINEMIKRALTINRPNMDSAPPRYGYVGPSFAQTKDLIWGYLKHYTANIPGVKVSEGDLQVTLPNGATITLYGGASAYERMRGIYFDGIVLDEFPLLNPTVFSTVVRPCLADYRGWAIISGTSNGDDHFHELKKKNEKDPSWDFFIIPVTKTDALHPDEVQEMTKDMTDAEYAREMLCEFNAPVEGAYYADLLNKAMMAKPSRITGVPYDPSSPVMTWWDLGIDDYMCIWFVQRVGRELHVIDYYENSGLGLDHYAQIINGKGYVYSCHIPPHDIKARELGTGRSRLEILQELLNEPVIVAPMAKVEDGIAAVRSIFPMLWFDEEKTEAGRAGLRNYRRSKSGQPVHNWASHPADAFRTGAVGLNQAMAVFGGTNITVLGGRLRRRIRNRA